MTNHYPARLPENAPPSPVQISRRHKMIRFLGLKIGESITSTDLPPEKPVTIPPLISKIHAENASDFRSTWSLEGLIIDWNKPVPTAPDYVAYRRDRLFKYARRGGVAALILGASALGEAALGAESTAVVSGLVGELTALASMSMFSIDSIKGYRHRRTYDKTVLEIGKAAEEARVEFSEPRLLERAQGMEHAYRIDDRTYTLHGDDAAQLMRSQVAIPARYSTIPAATVIAEFMALDQSPRSDIFSPVQSASNVTSVETGHNIDGEPYMRFNPARGIAHLLQVADSDDGGKILDQSFPNLQNIYTNQARVANLANQSAIAVDFDLRDDPEDQVYILDSHTSEAAQLALDFLSIGAAYMANQPVHRQTAITS